METILLNAVQHLALKATEIARLERKVELLEAWLLMLGLMHPLYPGRSCI